MILHSVNYFRDFKHDFPSKIPDKFLEKICKITIAALPLLATIRSLQTPISIAAGCARSITHISALTSGLSSKNINKLEISYNMLQTCLSTSSVALTILTPAFGLLASSVSDMIANTKECMSCLNAGKYKEAGAAFARLLLSTLIISAISYGSIEFTVAAMTLQIILVCFESIEHFRKGEFIEAFLKALTVGVQVKQSIPQAKLLYWKYSYHPVLTGTLRQDNKGFVYLDIPDEYLKDLHQLFKETGMELPPYFGNGKAGAHVSVIMSNEMLNAAGINISEIGQNFEFRIANIDSIQPKGFKGVDKVWFLTLSCPALLSLREKYGLSPRLNENHDYHMTFGLHYDSSR